MLLLALSTIVILVVLMVEESMSSLKVIVMSLLAEMFVAPLGGEIALTVGEELSVVDPVGVV